MEAIQIECQCSACGYKWFYLPFEETRLLRAELLRYEVHGNSGRRRWGFRRNDGYARESGCGCGDAGCLFLEGFACAEMFDGCGCLGCSALPLTMFTGIAILAPFTHLFTKLARKDLPLYHRACPACDNGMFERTTVLYKNGRAEQLSKSIQLPVVNPVVFASTSTN